MPRRNGREKRGPFRVNPRTGALELSVVLTLYDDPLRDGPTIAYLERAVQMGMSVATAFRTLCRQGGVKAAVADTAAGEVAGEAAQMDLSAIGDEL